MTMAVTQQSRPAFMGTSSQRACHIPWGRLQTEAAEWWCCQHTEAKQWAVMSGKAPGPPLRTALCQVSELDIQYEHFPDTLLPFQCRLSPSLQTSRLKLLLVSLCPLGNILSTFDFRLSTSAGWGGPEHGHSTLELQIFVNLESRGIKLFAQPSSRFFIHILMKTKGLCN